MLKTRGFNINFNQEVANFEIFTSSKQLAVFQEHEKFLHLENNLKYYTFLVPYIDFVNHTNSQRANCNVELDQNNNWCLYAVNNIPAGQEVLLNYNPEPTSSILLTYGFVEKPLANQHEKIIFLPEEIASSPEKYARLERVGLASSVDNKGYDVNQLYVSHLAGCSWGLQKAALISGLSCPEEVSFRCQTFQDIYDGNYNFIPEKIKERTNSFLRKILVNKIRSLESRARGIELDLQNMLESDLKESSQNTLNLILDFYQVQIIFLQNFVSDNDSFYSLYDFGESHADVSENESDDSGQGTCQE